MIIERQKTSLTWWIIHKLGSLQLALFLLGTIAIACAVATLTESSFNTKIAQTYIYKAPWFIFWLCVLCVNLFAVTLTRWPWEKKHIGFIVTHYGIITLLIGAMIGLHFGFEGNVTLHKDEPPLTKVTLNRSIVQLDSPIEDALYVMPFDVSTIRPSTSQPRLLDVPGTALQIVVDAWSNHLVKTKTLTPSEEGNPGVLLRFTSARMAQDLEIPLVLNGSHPQEENFFGLATIVFQPTLPPVTTMSPNETQIVFSKFPPVIHSEAAASGITIQLSSDGGMVTLESTNGTSTTHPRTDIIHKPIAIGSALVNIENYWPDFEMRDGKPATRSDKPNNPTILVHIQTLVGKPSLLLAPESDGSISYRLQRGGTIYASGTTTREQAFPLGWADWQAEVIASYPTAIITSLIEPGSHLTEDGLPGFRAHLASPGNQSVKSEWISSGEITSLTNGEYTVHIGYGLQLHPLPFSLRLLDFTVPRYEGAETPSNFIATIEFTDLKTNKKKIEIAKMNHPASFPGTLWATLSGINYKFSQAEWNPQDLNETTLQVLYDPGWLLKWVGSLAICLGIGTMFYFTPRSYKQK